jgi:hypothetical protein
MSKFHDLRCGERLVLDGPGEVELLEKSGRRAKLKISASPDVTITIIPAHECPSHMEVTHGKHPLLQGA